VSDFPVNNPALYQKIRILSSDFRIIFAIASRFSIDKNYRGSLRCSENIQPLSTSIPLIASNHASIIPEFLSIVKPSCLLYSSISLWGLIEGLYRFAHSRCASILSQSRAPVKPQPDTTWPPVFSDSFEKLQLSAGFDGIRWPGSVSPFRNHCCDFS